ncbi:MAG: AAA family ATPase [Terriglobales bacterium]
MRKWMRDRLKRPKKNAEAGKSEPAQAPLQPAYYDTPEAPAATVPMRIAEAKTAEPEIEARFASDPESGNESTEPVSPQPRTSRPDANNDPRRRRRRGRGGRGRGGSQPSRTAPAASTNGQAETAQPAVAAAETAGAAGASPATAPRASKGTVILAIGLPGSGKSSWFKRHNVTPLSSDMLRSLLFDDPTEQRFQDLIFSNLRSMLKARLIARRPLNYVDATNLTPHERQSWIKLGQDYGYEVQAVFFDVPLEVCLERNHKRERVVADDVMRRMSSKLKPPTFEEGFSKITVVRVKRKSE